VNVALAFTASVKDGTDGVCQTAADQTRESAATGDVAIRAFHTRQSNGEAKITLNDTHV
jgi:hypothetical protein